VEHAEARIARLHLAIEEAVKSTPPKMKAVIEGLQALRGIAQVAAVTIVAELGKISRFSRARLERKLQRQLSDASIYSRAVDDAESR
jgi:transposase